MHPLSLWTDDPQPLDAVLCDLDRIVHEREARPGGQRDIDEADDAAEDVASLGGRIRRWTDQGAAAVGMVAMSPQTGEYEYICIMPDGNSWSLYVGEPTTDCHGSFMHKYINGSMVANISLAPQPASSINPHAWDCIFALAGSVALIWDPPAETWIWITSAAAAGWGLQACLA